MMAPTQWQLYLVRCSDGSLYTGIATDAERRFAEHQSQGAKCAKYLRGKAPLKLVYTVPAGDRAQASRWEYSVKRLSKAHKEALVAGRKQLKELMEPAE
jgi:putative endonuclease